MKRAMVSEVKAHLSAYLADVRRGETIEICDRRTPVARLVPIAGPGERAVIDEATRPVRDLLRIKPVRPRGRVNATRLLRESRDQR